MARDWTPDFYVARYTDLTADELAAAGIRGVITDLDDTLVPHNAQTVPDALTAWLDALRAAGISVLILSNNSRRRVLPFAQKIGVPFFSRACKPFAGSVRRACRALGLPREQCLVLGDQIFTDVAAAKNAGVRSALVDPVGARSTRFVRLKRRRETKLRAQFRKKT